MSPNYRTETREAVGSRQPPFDFPPRVEVLPPPSAPPHSTRGGLFQACGIHPGIALFTLVVDTMLFGADGLAVALGLPTGGISLFLWLIITCAVGWFVGHVAIKGQMSWAGDTAETAKVKGLVVGFLTAVPTPLPSLVYVPMGVMGLVNQLRRRA